MRVALRQLSRSNPDTITNTYQRPRSYARQEPPCCPPLGLVPHFLGTWSLNWTHQGRLSTRQWPTLGLAAEVGVQTVSVSLATERAVVALRNMYVPGTPSLEPHRTSVRPCFSQNKSTWVWRWLSQEPQTHQALPGQPQKLKRQLTGTDITHKRHIGEREQERHFRRPDRRFGWVCKEGMEERPEEQGGGGECEWRGISRDSELWLVRSWGGCLKVDGEERGYF